MTRVHAALAVLLMLLIPSHSPAAAKWLRLRSPHFVVIGDAGERELRQVAERVEGFREALRRALPNATVATPVPTTIIVFGSDAAFTPFKPLVNGKPMERVGGFFQPGDDANHIVMSLESGERAYRIIFHEYTHALLSATVGSVPVWMNEGLAEVYSTFKDRDGGKAATIGIAPPEHVSDIRQGALLPLEQLMAVGRDSPIYNEGRRRGMFYAQSWALTHYLLFGNQARRDQFPKYLDLLERGTPIPDAFRQAFECEPRALEGELRTYARQFTMNVLNLSFGESFKLAARLSAEPISEAEAHFYTAELLARSGRTDDARARIERGLQAEPGSPRGLAAMGRLHLRDNRPEEGLPLLERAASLLPDDAAVAATFARALMEQFRLRAPTSADDADALARTRAALARAAALDPEDAYVIAMQGYVEHLDGSHPDRARAFYLRAIAQAPAREDYRLMLAQVLIAEKNFTGAQMLLGPLVARGSDQDVRESARRLLARTAPEAPPPVAPEIDAGSAGRTTDAPASDSTRTSAPAPAGGSSGGSGTANPAPAYAADGTVYRLMLRDVGAGEMRVAGEFERVECGAGAIVLHLRLADRVLRLRARAFDAVDFINYRTDPVAPPTCGILDQPLRALATYRALRGTSPARR